MPKCDTPGIVKFRTEFFVLDREAYFRTSEGENGKSKQKSYGIKGKRKSSTLLSYTIYDIIVLFLDNGGKRVGI